MIWILACFVFAAVVFVICVLCQRTPEERAADDKDQIEYLKTWKAENQKKETNR